MPKPSSSDPASQLPMPIGVETFSEMTKSAFAGLGELNGSMYASAIKLNAEWAEFLRGRLETDLKTPALVAACKSPQEAQQVCVDYWMTAFTQYQRELAKLSEIFVAQTAPAVQNQMKAISRGMVA